MAFDWALTAYNLSVLLATIVELYLWFFFAGFFGLCLQKLVEIYKSRFGRRIK